MRKGLFLILLGIVVLCGAVLSPAKSSGSESSLDGRYVNNDFLIKKYGEFAFQALRKFPGLVDVIKKAKGDFKRKDIDTSFPTAVFVFNDGKECLVFGGCTPHDCGGTRNVIVYELQANRAYVLREQNDRGDFRI